MIRNGVIVGDIPRAVDMVRSRVVVCQHVFMDLDSRARVASLGSAA